MENNPLIGAIWFALIVLMVAIILIWDRRKKKRLASAPPVVPIQQQRREAAIRWANDVLARKNEFLIVDTETTGLDDDDVIIHFAAMDLDGLLLIDTYVKPTQKRKASADAEFIHGISSDTLKTAPFFEVVMGQFIPIAAGKTVLIYNAEFHSRLMDQTYEIDGLLIEGFDGLRVECIRERFHKFHNRDRLALPGRKNTGMGDCRAALKVIEEMAAADK